MSEIIMLSDVRLSFPHLIEPQKDQTNDGKFRLSYNAEFIMPSDHKGFKQFMGRVGEIATAEWKEHAQSVMQIIGQDRKLRCYGQGKDKVSQKTFQVYSGYDGNVYITAGCTTISDSPDAIAKRPQMIQADGSPVDPMNTMAYQQVARKLYGGCRVNAAVRPWPQNNKHGRGIRCDLIAVQFLRDDEAFGEAPIDVTDYFGAVKTDAAPKSEDTGVMPPFLT